MYKKSDFQSSFVGLILFMLFNYFFLKICYMILKNVNFPGPTGGANSIFCSGCLAFCCYPFIKAKK